jgi:hypothetical protein
VSQQPADETGQPPYLYPDYVGTLRFDVRLQGDSQTAFFEFAS